MCHPKINRHTQLNWHKTRRHKKGGLTYAAYATNEITHEQIAPYNWILSQSCGVSPRDLYPNWLNNLKSTESLERCPIY